MRVASLLPAATEVVYALGAGDLLVARSHACDHPPEARRLPACTRPRTAAPESAAIQRDVSALLEQGLSVFEVDAERLAELAPDVVLTQDQCDVCAVTPAQLRGALSACLPRCPELVTLHPATLDDVFADMLQVAEALDREPEGRQLVERLRGRMDALAQRAADEVRRAGAPSVVTIEWLDPVMAAGNWMPELVALAGGVEAIGESGRHSPWVAWDDVVAADPDVLVVSPCGFDHARTRAEMASLTGRPGWGDLRAVRGGRVY
ncbi:MAG: cobalamin-binding protein, partial [Gemmatimonadetes bacterium]